LGAEHGLDEIRVRTFDFFFRRFLEPVLDFLYRGNSSLEIMDGVLEMDDDTEAVSLSVAVGVAETNDDCDSNADGSKAFVVTGLCCRSRHLLRLEDADI